MVSTSEIRIAQKSDHVRRAYQTTTSSIAAEYNKSTPRSDTSRVRRGYKDAEKHANRQGELFENKMGSICRRGQRENIPNTRSVLVNLQWFLLHQ
jgi:hypothetical protein